MILPLSHEKRTVSRLPWVTFALLGLTVATHLWSIGSPGAERVDRALDEVVEYLVEHPYLEPDPQIASPELMDEAFGRDRHPPRGTATGMEQQRLDRLTETWREARRDHPLRRGGLIPSRFRPANLVTHVFLHGGFLHLFFNLLFLYLLAPFVEEVFGHLGFAAFYLAAGIVAGGLYAWQYHDLDVPLIGASGAVAAVMGAFLLLRGRVKIRFLVFLGIAAFTFHAPAWLMLPLWFLGELLSALRADVEVPGMGGGGVAYWAHVWGFLFGLVTTKIASGRVLDPQADSPTGAGGGADAPDPEILSIQEDVRRGFVPRAWEQLEALLARRPNHEDALELSWQLARRLDRPEEAATAARRLASFALRREETDRAAAYLAGTTRSGSADPELDMLWIRLAEQRQREGREAEAEEVVRRLIAEGAPEALPESFRDKLARLAAELRSRPGPSS